MSDGIYKPDEKLRSDVAIIAGTQHTVGIQGKITNLFGRGRKWEEYTDVRITYIPIFCTSGIIVL